MSSPPSSPWTSEPTPPMWSMWPWVLNSATSRRPWCSRRSTMAAGSGGASMSTHSPPGPSGATSHALVCASQSGSPSMSIGGPYRAALRRPGGRRRAAGGVPDLCTGLHGRGDRRTSGSCSISSSSLGRGRRQFGHSSMVPGRFGPPLHRQGVVQRGQPDQRRRHRPAPGAWRRPRRPRGRHRGSLVVWRSRRCRYSSPVPSPAHPEGGGLGEVGAGPDPGDRGEVVGRDGGERLRRELRRGLVLEPQQAVREDVALGQLVADVVLDGAEVLADDEGAGPVGLERDEVEELAGRGSARRRRRPGPTPGGIQ